MHAPLGIEVGADLAHQADQSDLRASHLLAGAQGDGQPEPEEQHGGHRGQADEPPTHADGRGDAVPGEDRAHRERDGAEPGQHRHSFDEDVDAHQRRRIEVVRYGTHGPARWGFQHEIREGQHQHDHRDKDDDSAPRNGETNARARATPHRILF